MYESACAKYLPSVRPQVKQKSCKWMSAEIRSKKKAKNKLWFRCRSCGFRNPELVREYSKCKSEYQRTIRQACRSFELDLVKRSKNDPKLLYSYIKAKQKVKSNISALRDTYGNITTDPTRSSIVLTQISRVSSMLTRTTTCRI